jgi:MerR family transcriptional regulator, Zn(II)-responsive regulator of zntA
VSWPRQPGPPTKPLRFYEDSGLLPPTEGAANGYRDYGMAALSWLGSIRRGRAAGLSLAQIRQVIDIRDAGDAPCHECAPTVDGAIGRHRSAER